MKSEMSAQLTDFTPGSDNLHNNQRLSEKFSDKTPEHSRPVQFDDELLQYRLELDKTGQVHLRCYEGKDLVADVACTVPGITRLINAGLLRKPRAWKIGALRDWLELDGQLFRFDKGPAGIAELERTLNQRYHPADDPACSMVQVFANPAAASGFDIQFPAEEGGAMENRRRHLESETMELFSNPQNCRVLRKGLVVKFTPPTFHFKQKTPDGGERDLDCGSENVVSVTDQQGNCKWIDLSQPISHIGLGADALTAIFNHPSLRRHVRRTPLASSEAALDRAA